VLWKRWCRFSRNPKKKKKSNIEREKYNVFFPFLAKGGVVIKRAIKFIADILGLNVFDHSSGELYGTLNEVITPGGREVYIINDVKGGTFMVPAVPEFIKDIRTEGENAGIYVELIEGMREVAE